MGLIREDRSKVEVIKAPEEIQTLLSDHAPVGVAELSVHNR